MTVYFYFGNIVGSLSFFESNNFVMPDEISTRWVNEYWPQRRCVFASPDNDIIECKYFQANETKMHKPTLEYKIVQTTPRYTHTIVGSVGDFKRHYPDFNRLMNQDSQ